MQTCPSLKLDVTQMYFFDRSVCHQLGDTLRAIRVDLPTFFKHIQIRSVDCIACVRKG